MNLVEFILDVDTCRSQSRVVVRTECIEVFRIDLGGTVSTEQVVFKENTYFRHSRISVRMLGSRNFDGSNQVFLAVRAELADRKLATGQDHRLAQVFQHEAEGRGGESHGVRSMQNHETIVFVVILMLPMAHMYGLAFEFLYEFCNGCHVYFLTRMPSPKIILQAFAEVKPKIVVAVPLIIEKIIKKNVLPKLETPTMKFLLNVPFVSDKIREKVREQVMNAFGGNFYEVIVGGAAFNQEVEAFMRSINFPYTVGYGMTECAPIISYEDWEKFKAGSCGKPAPRMEVQILSRDPQNVPGEIVTRGDNVMLGYYKNQEATDEVIDADGWMHTGDLGVMDAEGNITIKGRSKNMLLGPSGQNIYPEEIEDKLNNLPYVNESIVIQALDGKLAALVYPDFDAAFANGLTEKGVEEQMEANRVALNTQIAAYEQIARVKIYHEEFEKTPKKSIKRFLYQEAR